MRRILAVDDHLHTRLAIRAWLKRCGFRVAIADGGKPFRPATLPSVIDECLSEAEPHRKYAATLAAAETALSEQQNATTP
jgi:CheY-like chemotaxis protein